jgi:hypothetical protein
MGGGPACAINGAFDDGSSNGAFDDGSSDGAFDDGSSNGASFPFTIGIEGAGSGC